MTDKINKVQALNQITAIIDEKATRYRADYTSMPHIRRTAEKKLVIDLINDGIELAASITSTDASPIAEDLKTLKEQLERL